ncbi:MAG: LysR family transcriptional regulator [Lautropia sp.]
MPPIDFLGLQAFLAIAKCGSFQRAAGELHLSQTAVSHRLRKLEQLLDTRLVARTSRGVTLTSAGRDLLPKARDAVHALQLALETAHGHGALASRTVAIACLPTIAASQLGPILAAFRRAEPSIDVRVHDVSIREIEELVRSGQAAFGVTVEAPRSPGLVAEAIAVEPFVVACLAGHRLAGRDAIGLRDLQDEPMVRISLPAGNSAVIDEALAAHEPRLAWRYEVQRTALALALVRAGLGLTIVPALSIEAGDAVLARPLGHPRIARRLLMITREGAATEGPAQALRERFVSRLAAAVAGGEPAS